MESEKLTALVVDRAYKRQEPAMLNDGQGLYFRKQAATGGSWTLRYKVSGKPRWMALGSYPDMSLAEARKEARKQRDAADALMRLGYLEAGQSDAAILQGCFSSNPRSSLVRPTLLSLQQGSTPARRDPLELVKGALE